MDRQYERRVGAWSAEALPLNPFLNPLTPGEIGSLSRYLEETEPQDLPGVTRAEVNALRDAVTALQGIVEAFGPWQRKPVPSVHPDQGSTYLSPAARWLYTEHIERGVEALNAVKEAIG